LGGMGPVPGLGHPHPMSMGTAWAAGLAVLAVAVLAVAAIAPAASAVEVTASSARRMTRAPGRWPVAGLTGLSLRWLVKSARHAGTWPQANGRRWHGPGMHLV